MIYNIQTFCTYGYWPDTDLKPRSNKPIIAACDKCGKIRITSKDAYRDLCQSCSKIKLYKDPLEHKKLSDGHKKSYQDNPIIAQQISESLKETHINDPTIAQQMSESQSRRWDAMDDPSQEMVTHHYIYDFNDLTKYTIEVTRSEHTTIHNNLRFAKLEIPHINIMKED